MQLPVALRSSWVCLVVLGLLIAACAAPTPSAQPAGQSPSAPMGTTGQASPAALDPWQQLLVDGRQEGTVVVVGPPFPTLREAYVEQFKQDTGIELQYVGLPTAEGPARAEREALAGRTTMDVLLGGGTELTTMVPKGLLEPIAPVLVMPEVRDTPRWADGRPLFMDQKQQFLFRTASTVYGAC